MIKLSFLVNGKQRLLTKCVCVRNLHIRLLTHPGAQEVHDVPSASPQVREEIIEIADIHHDAYTPTVKRKMGNKVVPCCARLMHGRK